TTVPSDPVTVAGPPADRSKTFTKTHDGPFSAAGDTVEFTLAVTNDGNVTLTGATITDPFFDPALTCAVPDLAPGESHVCPPASHVVTQDDVDAGQITNTATISV